MIVPCFPLVGQSGILWIFPSTVDNKSLTLDQHFGSCFSIDNVPSSIENVFILRNVLLSWSSGKDSAWSLHVLRQQPDIKVAGLLTTVNESAQRVAMHAVRRELLDAQAKATGLPVTVLNLPWPCSNADYERTLAGACKNAIDCGINAVAFGDLYLRDIRAYREKQLQGTGLEPLFPLWEIPTTQLARDMMSAGLRARITCVDLKKLPESFAGREWDAQLISDLPPGTDPCGENGEFHTFCYAGPMFPQTIDVAPGETVVRDGFAFADLTLAQPPRR